MKGGENENMAVMLNVMAMDGKPLAVSKNGNVKNSGNGDKPAVGFAKTLDVETEKSSLDSNGDSKNKDDVQLMAAMANMVSPIVANVMPANQGVADEMIQSEISAQIQSPVSVSTAAENQLSMAVLDGLQAQLAAAMPNDTKQTQVTAAMTNDAKQTQVTPAMTNDALQVNQNTLWQAQSDVAALNGTSPKVQDLQNQLAPLVAQMTPAAETTQQPANLAELQTKQQTVLSQTQKAEPALESAEVLLTNPMVSTVVSHVSQSIPGNELGKNNKKQLGDQVISDLPFAIDVVNAAVQTTDTPVLVAAPEVKEAASQMTVSVSDALTSKNQEMTDEMVTAPITKDTDVFSQMLHQQGVRIDNQVKAEVKPELVQPAPDSYQITSQIVDQARLVSGLKNTEMIIKLTPEHLGELTFKVSVENGVVSASFHSNNSEVRTVIESSLYQLKQEMLNQGLKIDNVGVYAGLGQFFSNGQQSGNNQQTTVKVQSKKNEEDFLDLFEATDAVNQAADGTGVDYRA